MARDKPLLFSLIAVPLMLFLMALMVFILAILYRTVLLPYGLEDRITYVNLLIAIPIAPVMWTIGLLFGEIYFWFVFRLIRLNKIIGFVERKLAHILAGWAERKLASRMKKKLKEGNNG